MPGPPSAFRTDGGGGDQQTAAELEQVVTYDADDLQAHSPVAERHLDETTMPSRSEPELDDVAPGDERDTSTARALAQDLRAYGLGNVLDDDARATLVEAPRGSVTGPETIRAGVPDGWVVGNKTGTPGHGGRHDIGLLWPPASHRGRFRVKIWTRRTHLWLYERTVHIGTSGGCHEHHQHHSGRPRHRRLRRHRPHRRRAARR